MKPTHCSHLDEEFPPSRVLFELAPEPYRVYLADFKSYESGKRDVW